MENGFAQIGSDLYFMYVKGGLDKTASVLQARKYKPITPDDEIKM